MDRSDCEPMLKDKDNSYSQPSKSAHSTSGTRSTSDVESQALQATQAVVWNPSFKSTSQTHTLALLLFLEDADSVAVDKGHLKQIDSSTYGASWWLRKAENVLDRVVRYAQPRPKVAHVELLLLDKEALSKQARAHMATYIGDRADWRDSDDFYQKRRWRAIPVLIGTEHNLRHLCNDEVGTAYSLMQYFANMPPLRWVPRLWRSQQQQTAAHCACLSARVLCRANVISAEPALQTPSSLYNLMLQTCPMTRSLLGSVPHEHFATTASAIEIMDDATLQQHSVEDRLHLLDDLVWRTLTAGEMACVPNHVSSQVALESDELRLLQHRLSVQALRLVHT